MILRAPRGHPGSPPQLPGRGRQPQLRGANSFSPGRRGLGLAWLAAQRRGGGVRAAAQGGADAPRPSADSTISALESLCGTGPEEECEPEPEEPQGERKESVVVQLEGRAVEYNLRVSGASTLFTLDVAMPLGITFEEVADDLHPAGGYIVVAEVLEGGGAFGLDIREGDVLRGTTAISMIMTYPAGNLLLGGVGRPKEQQLVFITGRSLTQAISAMRSNADMGDGTLTLILERP
mmetsp:Transcript_14931/g.47571  ORF Transcript_14931/g.47571 Transcript_14931/m.47571 type:complete len:235 (+) Transcript_14931:25-729(+)